MSLGTPIPDQPHAVSVSLPTWADVVAYEEGDPAVAAALRGGYPRFVLHPAVKALCAAVEAGHGLPREHAWVWPSRAVAERVLAFVGTGRLLALAGGGVATLLPEEARSRARAYWQHTGEIVSSRRAEALLAGEPEPAGASEARRALAERVAAIAGVAPGRVSLHPSGMAALAAALRQLEGPTAQLGFPYVDSLLLQEKVGAGVRFFPAMDEADFASLEAALAAGELAGIFCEFPSNPLMRAFDLPRVSALARAHGVPLVLDDSAAAFGNHDFLPYADMLVASLTKAFGGSGTAMGGALITREPLDAEDLLYGADAAVLLAGSADFLPRLGRLNATCAYLAERLQAHPAVRRVHHPSLEPHYRTPLRAGGGGGTMLALELHDPVGFYDRLTLAKGPSFGLPVTVVCPYTLLAHYHALDFAASHGVARDLVRVAVGLEEPERLWAAFEAALSAPRSLQRC